MASHVNSERIRLAGAAERKIPIGGMTKDTGICRTCLGSGTVSIWSEIAYFDDRRPCSTCEAGGRVESKISDILKKAQLEEHLSS
jgi:DnaJ-class molecular chaperone